MVGACATPVPFIDDENPSEIQWPDNERITYRIFLLGNIAGVKPAEETPVLDMLKHHVNQFESGQAIVFLGNSIPCCGRDAVDNHYLETYLTEWLDIGRHTRRRLIMVPGHYEYPESEGAYNLESYVEGYLEEDEIVLPASGHPGPQAVKLADGIRLVALDTQYWMNNYTLPLDSLTDELHEPADVLLELEERLFKYRDENVILVGHHPLYSNGNYGGRFSLSQYIWPVPVASGLLVGYRSVVGRSQDLSSSRYRLFRNELTRILQDKHNIVYAAAHDHSLQYFLKDNRRRIQHHIVSGSAVSGAYVSRGRGAEFATSEEGFMVVDFLSNGSAWLSAWVVDVNTEGGIRRFRRQLWGDEGAIEQQIAQPSVVSTGAAKQTFVQQAINPKYASVRGVGKLLAGKQYRDLWAALVDVPVFDINAKAGGLEPIQVGGQSQSVTMRFKNEAGRTYMIRSIDKVATRSLSADMRRTFARNIVQDQVAMMHPYGAFIIPSLSKAAGIYHTIPELVFIPPGSPAGMASPFLANQIVLFEERPDEDMSANEHFGFSKNVIGSAKLMRELEDDSDHYVDAASFARARLFDMLIADHDRTLDNFRWASFEPYELNPALTGDARTQGKIYRPIPRDRDKAFAKVDGLLPGLYRLFAEPAWQPFSESYGYLKGLNRKGLALDRRFAASLLREDWVRIAEDVQYALTDSVIEASVNEWPEPVQVLAGQEMVETLKIRRDQLPDVASRYYDVLASVIDVIGSNKHEQFEVHRLDDDKTEIVVHKMTHEGELRQEVFRRIVAHTETKEIRLYGLAGNDRFIVDGEAEQGVKVVIVGGAGEDVLTDHSDIRKGAPKTIFYDIPQGTRIESGKETRATLSLSPGINQYDFDGFKPDLVRPLGYFGANADDGVFLGAGLKWTRHGFRKNPHANAHQFMGNYAARTHAFNVRYLGNFESVLGAWDLDVEFGAYNPNNIRNFYGLGNETEDSENSRRYYQARFSRVILRSALKRYFDSGLSLQAGPSLEITDVRNEADRFIRQPQAGISPGSFDHLLFGGGRPVWL